MNIEADFDLSTDQWNMLKALRLGTGQRRVPNPMLIDQLVSLGLVEVGSDGPHISPLGRTVLIRGSSRLWEDVAA